jgi:hypothetical protein
VTVPAENLSAVRKLLFESSAQIRGVGGAKGSGFYVDDHLVLTCAHVVNGAEKAKVRILPFRRAARDGRILRSLPGDAADVALVEVDRVDGEEPQPAVVLDARLDDQVGYYAVGYPKGTFDPEAGIEELQYLGHRRLAGDAISQLILDAGQAAVTPGISGGAVLNPSTGAVAAIVQYTNRSKEPLGGGAIPLERAAAMLEEIAKLVDDPPLAAKRWKEALGEDAWMRLGKRMHQGRTVDLSITRSGTAWKVRVAPQADETEMTGQQLPAEVAEALFQWAQWRRIRSPREVNLLGRLLGFAAFPPAVLDRIARGSLSEELLVRLRFDANEDLADVPWEFASVPRGGKLTTLAAEEGLALVRVGNHEGPEEEAVSPPDGGVHVLGIVMAPDLWHDRMPEPQIASETIEWPPVEAITTRLRQAVEAGGMTFTSLVNPMKFLLENNLSPRSPKPPDVIHYIGFCRDGDLALSNGEGGVDWWDVQDVLAKMSESGARMIVLEFALPPSGNDWDAVPPRDLLTLRRKVCALIFTRYPVHPRQFAHFNDVLYSALAKESVESAVQRARTSVAANKPLSDAAGFGWFTLVTGEHAGVRLVPASPAGPRDPGARQPDAGTVSRGPGPRPEDSAPRDAFEGGVR